MRPPDDVVAFEGQAKLGSLFSLAAALIAILVSLAVDFTDLAEPEPESGDADAPFPGAGHDADPEEEDEEHDDEFLEHMLAVNQVEQIRQIQHQVTAVERDHDISRAEVIQRYKTATKPMPGNAAAAGGAAADRSGVTFAGVAGGVVAAAASVQRPQLADLVEAARSESTRSTAPTPTHVPAAACIPARVPAQAQAAHAPAEPNSRPAAVQILNPHYVLNTEL